MIFSLLFVISQSQAALSIKDAKAEIQTATTAESLSVTVKPPVGTKLNFDGPWKLKFTDVPLAEARTYKSKDFDKEKKQFMVPIKKEAFSGSYKMTYFICAKDNSWCKRLVHKGTVAKAQ